MARSDLYTICNCTSFNPVNLIVRRRRYGERDVLDVTVDAKETLACLCCMMVCCKVLNTLLEMTQTPIMVFLSGIVAIFVRILLINYLAAPLSLP